MPDRKNYENAVKTADGKLKNFTTTVGGKRFSCDCGCNVFHKPDKDKLHIYKCNSCETIYTSE